MHNLTSCFFTPFDLIFFFFQKLHNLTLYLDKIDIFFIFLSEFRLTDKKYPDSLFNMVYIAVVKYYLLKLIIM